ncbi:GTPase Der [Tepiditoga spiralis]|uniref:GTPase Der n=1 Tax=Tepiditoga spiralis TaxID=2108365 RepID=A0A7G1G6K3_9BACT|nr:ribosome biogenesis GTPase Der [Tepiditoga spiralis]BBE30463.1 GTPase Der [Tepiditoga spiralis]
MAEPIVLIIGKPNVGKSTLFNRIIREKKSIVLDFPGVTRDHVYGEARWGERAFTLVDTCGIFENPEGIIERQQKQVVLSSVKEASLVLFVIDGREGITSEDIHVVEFLRKAGVEIVFVANKIESYEKYERNILPELYEIGFGEPIPVSAEHNKNIDELIDTILERLEQQGIDTTLREENDDEIVKVAIIGKPNAGKSSLFNKITGLKKAIVSDIPGTTRDIVDEIVEFDGKKYKFIDTAGMRKKSTVEYGTVEMYSIVRTIKAIERADVVIIVVDSTEGITHQDQKVAGLAENKGKATIVAFNKWDLVKNQSIKKKEYEEYFEKEFYYIKYSPAIYTSAERGWGIEELIDSIDIVNKSRNRRIPTSALNAALERYLMVSPPPVKKGKRIKFYYATQVDVKPPVFTFYSNQPENIPKTYAQSLRNMIRKYIDPFVGTPLFIKFAERKK